MPDNDKKIVGRDIAAVQKGLWEKLLLKDLSCRKVDGDIWEVRSTVSDGIVRILFVLDKEDDDKDAVIILLHGFKKKSRKLPKAEKKTARERLREYRRMRN